MVNKLRANKIETSKGRVKLGKLEARTKGLDPKQAKKIRGGKSKKNSGPGTTPPPK